LKVNKQILSLLKPLYMNQFTIQTPTPLEADSNNFYNTLGFHRIENTNNPVFTDGKVIIEINSDRFARAGLRLYKSSWSEELKTLREKHTLMDFPEGYLTTDPNGVWIYLITSAHSEYPNEDESFSKLGNYAGVSIESISMKNSLEFYSILGFYLITGSIDNAWMTLNHPSGFNISFMKPLGCPHLFSNPSLTYFNGSSNTAIIQEIRTLGIAITEEITYFSKSGDVDNIIIRDPGGLGFFIFND